MAGKKWIRAIEGGTVVASGYRPALEGEYIIVRDRKGRQAYYGHGFLGSRQYQVGDTLGRGAAIMLLGKTGRASAAHIHFELRDAGGRSLDPERIFAGSLKYGRGGLIKEPVRGVGLWSGLKYLIGEAGPELVMPLNASLAQLIDGIQVATARGPLGMAASLVHEDHRQLSMGPALASDLVPITFNSTITINGAEMTKEEIEELLARKLQEDRVKFLEQVQAHRRRR